MGRREGYRDGDRYLEEIAGMRCAGRSVFGGVSAIAATSAATDFILMGPFQNSETWSLDL